MGLGQGRGVQSLTGTCASSSALAEEAVAGHSGHVGPRPESEARTEKPPGDAPSWEAAS